MAKRTILSYPDPRLHTVAKPVHGVERSTAVRVTALDVEGELQTIEAEGLLAVCIQHELDHLLGKVFVEYLSPLKRNRIKNKLLKQQREDQKLEQGEGRR